MQTKHYVQYFLLLLSALLQRRALRQCESQFHTWKNKGKDEICAVQYYNFGNWQAKRGARRLEKLYFHNRRSTTCGYENKALSGLRAAENQTLLGLSGRAGNPPIQRAAIAKKQKGRV
jgi:hypothetical protein